MEGRWIGNLMEGGKKIIHYKSGNVNWGERIDRLIGWRMGGDTLCGETSWIKVQVRVRGGKIQL